MACPGCKERSELLAKAREAYRRGDMQEAKRLLKEMFGTAVRDVDTHISMVMHGMLKPK